MAEPAEEPEEGEPAPLGALTTEIVAAYVSKNAVARAVLGHVIETVGRALAALGREEPKSDTAEPKAAVPVRRSIHDDHLVCLVCGKPQKTLRRHLDRAHHLTPETYRERFGLKSDYPMSAPGYARSVPSWHGAPASDAACQQHAASNPAATRDFAAGRARCRARGAH